jgi:hypothetical protein
MNQRQHRGVFNCPDHGDFSVRTGLRWGGVEPTLFPAAGDGIVRVV